MVAAAMFASHGQRVSEYNVGPLLGPDPGLAATADELETAVNAFLPLPDLHFHILLALAATVIGLVLGVTLRHFFTDRTRGVLDDAFRGYFAALDELLVALADTGARDRRVLEIGSGIGNLTMHLSRRRRLYYATDIDDEARWPEASVKAMAELGFLGIPLSVVTGGPGTGKTTSIHALMSAIRRHWPVYRTSTKL